MVFAADCGRTLGVAVDPAGVGFDKRRDVDLPFFESFVALGPSIPRFVVFGSFDVLVVDAQCIGWLG